MKENKKITCRACWKKLTSNLGKICTPCVNAGKPETPNPVKKTPRKAGAAGTRVALSDGYDLDKRERPRAIDWRGK